MKSLMLAAGLALAKFTFFPDANLLVWLFVALVLDLATGIMKSYALEQARTSRGFRQTVVKLTQYGGAIIVSLILGNTARQNGMDGTAQLLHLFDDGLVVFIIYIEVTSIFENLYAMNPESKMSQYFIKYVLNILTFQLKNNPATKILPKDETPV